MPVALARRNVWLALGWSLVLAVIYLSLTPKLPSPDISQIDKAGHFLAYTALMGWWSQLDTRHGRLALLFVLMGLSMEIAQSFTGYRQGDAFDMVVNSIGVGMGWLVTRIKPGWLRSIDCRMASKKL